MIDTGDWMTAREIPYDFAFLEKPPLKFWMVGVPIRLGLLPRDEFGFRAVDALLGAMAFGYVALFAYRLAGPAAAIASCLILFGLRDLVLQPRHPQQQHGGVAAGRLCGGLYHFLRWRHAGARRDALITGAWFTLAFLTKFVAAAFLPLVAVVGLALPRPGLLPKPLRACLADWLWAAALFHRSCSAPWFVYEYRQFGDKLIETMFLQHVFVRFTGALDPSHLQPWNHCFSASRGCSRRPAAVAGRAGRGAARSTASCGVATALAWTIVVWGVLPLALISGLSSKVLHYSYPFLPPLALAGGLALAAPISMLQGPARTPRATASSVASARLPASCPARGAPRPAWPSACSRCVVAGVALDRRQRQVRHRRRRARANSSVVRPLVVAAIALRAAQRLAARAHLARRSALLLLLPLGAARETLLCGEPAGARRCGRCASAPVRWSKPGASRGGAYAVSEDSVAAHLRVLALPLGSWDADDDARTRHPGPRWTIRRGPVRSCCRDAPSAIWRCSGCATGKPFRRRHPRPSEPDRAAAGAARRLHGRRGPRRRSRSAATGARRDAADRSLGRHPCLRRSRPDRARCSSA